MLKQLKKRITRSKKQTMIAIVNIFICCFMNAVFALNISTISQLYFFGDSLTDGGFNDFWRTIADPPTIPPLIAAVPGKAPTFTTFGGYTWSQYIARDIKGFLLPVYDATPVPVVPDTITNNTNFAFNGFVSGTLAGINYAAAGSTTNSIGFAEFWAPSLVQQVANFLATHPGKLDGNAVFFIWSGANDFLTALTAPNRTTLSLLTTAKVAATNIAGQVELLMSRGAKRIVVVSLPNLGLAPLTTQSGIPSLPGQMKNVSFTFNSMLNQALGEVLQRNHTHAKILYIDTYTLLEQVVKLAQAGKPYVIAGRSFSFVNVTTPACVGVSAIYCPSTAPQGFLFADVVHPTNEAHRIISLFVEQQMGAWAA